MEGEKQKPCRGKRFKLAICLGSTAALAILAVLGYLIMRTETGSIQESVVTVNGSPIYEEEFTMLLKDNLLQYEGKLCGQMDVPVDQTLLAFLGNDESKYRQMILKEHIKTLTGIRIQQALAEEYGVLEAPFSYESLLADMEAENQERQRNAANGEVVYGVTEFDIVSYYGYFMSSLPTDILEKLPDDILSVTDAMAEEYYQSLNAPTLIAGEQLNYTVYDMNCLGAAEPEDISAVVEAVKEELASGRDGEVIRGSQRMSAKQMHWDREALREMVRQGSNVEEALLGLAEKEISDVVDTGETFLIVRYDGFTKAPVLLDSERSAFRQELRERGYWELMEQRIREADVIWNEEAANRILGQLECWSNSG